jgi:3-oxoacyl-[acyl-carrier protein] reductase
VNLIEGRVAIVTGGSRGIGAAISRVFGRNGAKVCINYNTSVADAKKIGDQFSANHWDHLLMQGSVTDKEFIRDMVTAVMEKWGRIDIVVNNAGITRDKNLLFMSDDDWDAVMDIDLKSAFYLSKEVISTMIAQRSGRIINISSLTALMGRDGQSNYGAAKAGLIGFTKSLAREVAQYDILVNAIAAGLIDTRMTKKLKKELLEKLIELIPLQRIGAPEEIANAALFLASDLSSYITGTVLNVTGGQYM